MNRALRAWYRDKRVLVTGHTGFKGAWLSAWLQEAGADVAGYALAPEPEGLFAAAGLAAGMRSVEGDVRDRERLERCVRECAPHVVFHIAAQALVRRSYADPVATFATNVMGTVHLLEAVRRVGTVRALVVVTSDKCYANHGPPRALREDEPLGGNDPYSASKAGAEIATAAFASSYFGGGTVAAARAGNVIGGGDWGEDRLVPDLMRAGAARVPALIRRPEAVRPWQFVLEPLRGYLMLGRRLAEDGHAFAGSWNFGPRDTAAVPVRELVARISAAWGAVTATFAAEMAGPYEAPALRLDSRKAGTLLAWNPVLTLDEAVDLTVRWYRAVHDRSGSPGALVRDQLDVYERRVELAEGAP